MKITKYIHSCLVFEPVHDGYAQEFFVKLRNKNYLKHFEARGTKFLQAPGASISDGTEVVFKYSF